MGSSKQLRDDRLELPLTPAKIMLNRAASAEEGSLSVFVLDKRLEVAAEILADRCSFVLSAGQYDAVVVALEAAPRSRSGSRLERLFAEPSVLE